MTGKLPPIYFYLPQRDWPSNIPDSAKSFWQVFGWGIHNWTLQTYLYLKDDGFPCQLVGELPEEGIIIAHRDSLPYNLQANPKQLIVCIKADREQHPYAQIQIVQNPKEIVTQQTLLGDRCHLIPYWPQPGLIPRKPARGDQFKNIAFLGRASQLAPELMEPSWDGQIKALGLHWHIVDRDRWNDYSEIDAILAVRRFDAPSDPNNFKPPSKLINAWHAGVPAVLGREPAFQAARKSELDYIEVTSIDDVIVALKRLRDDQALRQAMIENGRVRAEETQPAMIVKQWRNFITDVAVPAYDSWCSASSWTQQLFFKRRYLAIKANAMKRRIMSLYLK